MVLVFLAITFWVPAVFGWGSLIGAEIDDRGLRLTTIGFLGLAALSAAGSAVSLFAVVGPAAAAVGLVGGYLAFIGRRPFSQIDRLLIAVLLAATATMAGLTLALHRHYDTGLYYLQAVRWITERPPTPGLANLHGRLGFGSAWTTLAAMLEIPGLQGRSALVVGALPLIFAAPAVASGFQRLAAGETAWQAHLQVGLIVPLLLGLQGIGSLHTDHPASLAGCLALVLLLIGLQNRKASSVGTALLLATFTFTIKLSSVVLLGGTLIVFLLLARSLPLADRLRYAIGPTLLLILWIARGLLLSGCIGWPATVACLPLSWSSPLALGRELAAVIRGWARYPGGPTEVALVGIGWLWPWCRIYARSALAWVALATAVAGAVTAWRHRRDLPPATRWAAGISAIGMVFWFVTAPDPRFGLIYLLGGPLALLAYHCSARMAAGTLAPRRLLRVVLIGAAVVAIAGLGSLARARPRLVEVRLFHWPEFPEARTRSVRTPSGLPVQVPVGSDQCWSAPLPCTPAVTPGLDFHEGRFTVGPSHDTEPGPGLSQ